MTEDIKMPRAGPVLRRLREHGGLTLEAVSEPLGWDRSRLYRYETGERTLYLSDVIKIAEALGLHAADVVVACLKDRYPSLRKRNSADARMLNEMIAYLKEA